MDAGYWGILLVIAFIGWQGARINAEVCALRQDVDSLRDEMQEDN